ncbi:hypothetical protein HHL22_00805 [Hymenobacter sp. RP-2-7]|uniref:Uncharacterized protein n=1 Tax=Hymenobacter polaris TaxID=2682546 RepID=A0A7Y0AAR3_9BACT|nr:hypothetical protein [Hymenobacter polaris]NML63737.1 hypothetical protein [Hymenobacter polaris]
MTVLYKRAYVLAALLGASQLAAGQSAPPPHAGPAGSDAWMDSVRRLPLPAQVAAVRARVLADTVLRHPPQYVCLTLLSASQREAYYQAERPRALAEQARPAGALLLYVVDGYPLADNYPAHTAAFLRQLAAQPIAHIAYLKSGAQATALYGTRGANGVVLLTSARAAPR